MEKILGKEYCGAWHHYGSSGIGYPKAVRWGYVRPKGSTEKSLAHKKAPAV
ncbi:hypothetical protein OKW96_03275 [Sphingobacterium sp. KU25419]|nr:hypothetical protein OKW96_03275 [Sphingobacterium sp. KU25419]